MNVTKSVRILIFLIVLYVVSIGLVYVLQKYIIFLPKKLAPDYVFKFSDPYEEFFLRASDGAQINALYFNDANNQKGVVLYFHGNADNLQRWGKYRLDFTERGYDVLYMDYRGFGKSTGEQLEHLMYEDARMAYDWLLKKYEAKDIIIYGRSLGTAFASELASQVPARMLILETPFDNMQNVMESRAPLILPQFKYRFPNDEFIQKVKYPIYIFHGTADKIVPYEIATNLKVFLKTGDDFFTIENGKHKNLNTFVTYQKYMTQLLGERNSQNESEE